MARKKEKVSREGAKVYSYIRVSTEMQVERYSLDAQRDRIKKEAEIHSMEIVREYADEGRSGKNVADRPAFLQMMDDIKEGKDGVAFVLVYKLSRFGRKTSEVLQYIEFMQDYGVNLICVEDCVDTSSDMGKFIPVSYNGKKTYRIEYAHPESSAPSKTTVESVATLIKSREEPDSKGNASTAETVCTGGKTLGRKEMKEKRNENAM